jgi:hypothetical protein
LSEPNPKPKPKPNPDPNSDPKAEPKCNPKCNQRCNHWCLVWLKPGGSVLFELPGFRCREPGPRVASSFKRGYGAQKLILSRMFLHFWERGTSTVRSAYGRFPHDVSSWNGALPNPEGPADAQRGGKGAFNRGYLSQMIFNRRESCSQLLIGSVPFDRRIGDPFTIFSEGAVPGRSREILRGEPAKVCQGVAGFERRLLSREMC